MGDEIRPGHAPRPDLPDAYLHRPRIDALLEEATQRRLSVLVAPAGSGKTMAVAGWAATHDHDVGRDIRWLPTELGHLLAQPERHREPLRVPPPDEEQAGPVGRLVQQPLQHARRGHRELVGIVEDQDGSA